MKIEVKVDASVQETTVVIYTDKVTDEIQQLAQRLAQDAPKVIVGFLEDEAIILAQEEIIRVYAENGRVYAKTRTGTFTLRQRLYELETRLDAKRFVRISNAEIINLDWVRAFDLSFSGTICVRLKDDETTFVSRRYVAKIKQVLGL